MLLRLLAAGGTSVPQTIPGIFAPWNGKAKAAAGSSHETQPQRPPVLRSAWAATTILLAAVGGGSGHGTWHADP